MASSTETFASISTSKGRAASTRRGVCFFWPARLPSRLLCVLCPRPRRQQHRGRLARLPGIACCASAYAVCTCGREAGAAPGRFPQGVFGASLLGTPWENNRGATPCRSVDYPRRRSIRMVSSVSAHATSEKTAPTAPALAIPGPATTADPTAVPKLMPMLNAVGSTELASIMALGWRCRATRMNMEIHGTERRCPSPKSPTAPPAWLHPEDKAQTASPPAARTPAPPSCHSQRERLERPPFAPHFFHAVLVP